MEVKVLGYRLNVLNLFVAWLLGIIISCFTFCSCASNGGGVIEGAANIKHLVMKQLPPNNK